MKTSQAQQPAKKSHRTTVTQTALVTADVCREGHGIFTYALLDALVKGDTNNNGTIELSEFSAHIQTLAPQLSRELRSSGKSMEHKSRAAITTMREAPVASRYADFRQKPRIGSGGRISR